MKIISIVSLALGALPLLLYPFVLLADIMSLCSDQWRDVPVVQSAVALSFLLGSLAYPVVYLLCLVFTCIILKKDKEKVVFCSSVVPLAYVAVLIGRCVAWSRVPNRSPNKTLQPIACRCESPRVIS